LRLILKLLNEGALRRVRPSPTSPKIVRERKECHLSIVSISSRVIARVCQVAIE
jgi:hypothetical protein